MDHLEYRDEIQEAVKHHIATMPANVKEAISKANTDLYVGPTYYDKDGNEASCFDEGAIPFDFKAACALISEYTNDISDLSEMVYAGDDDDGEPIDIEQKIDGSAQDIIEGLLGKELAKYC